ncbi:MAG: hypothetical protein FWD61_14070 [Phycisphaerales bacterium]|nr:hypothetical protein [Phycisphaerales bacterium]
MIPTRHQLVDQLKNRKLRCTLATSDRFHNPLGIAIALDADSRHHPNGPKGSLLVALDKLHRVYPRFWLLALFTNSTLDHELTHVVQESFADVLDRERRECGKCTGMIRWTRHFYDVCFAESHAGLNGLIASVIVSWPIVIILFLLSLLYYLLVASWLLST